MRSATVVALAVAVVAIALPAGAGFLGAGKTEDVNYYHVGDGAVYELCVENPTAVGPYFTRLVEVYDVFAPGTPCELTVDYTADFPEHLAPPGTPGASVCIASVPYVIGADCFVLEPPPNQTTVQKLIWNEIYASGFNEKPAGDEPASAFGADWSVVLTPCIEVTKTVDCEPSKWLDEVVYEVCIRNCDDTTVLYNITVVDDVMGDLSGYFEDQAPGELAELAPGAEVCADVPYTIPVGADDPHENTVTVTGMDWLGVLFPSDIPAASIVTDTATETVDLIDPAMTIVVSCNEPEPVPPGGTAEFSITVENTGDCNLVIPQDADFIPGETHTWYETEIAPGAAGLTGAASSAGRVAEVCHEACVTWTLDPELYCAMPNEGTVCHEECCPVGEPCIDVTKTVDCEPSKWLDEVVFEVCVENCGDVILYNIAVVDDVMGDLSGYFEDQAPGELAELAVGATVCVDVPYTIPVGATSPHENTVTATGYTDTERSVTDTSTETVDLINPAMTIVVSCNEPEPVAPGGTAEFSITVENTGDCNLVIPQDADFIPGETHTWYETETASTDPGVAEVCHEACVTWTLDPELYCAMPNEGTVCHEECCPVDDDPCIDVTKTVDCEPSKWLDEVVFEVCVENCGDVTLYNITVVDDVMGDLSGYFAVGELDELAVGATVCADVPYTIPVGATSPHENTVTATGYTVTTESVMDTATETVDLIDPAMTIVVSCNEPEPVAPGETAEFAITVENTGDCNLVIPTDSEFVPGETHTWYETETVPTDPGVTEVCHEACVTWTLDPELYCAMPNEGTVCHEECCPVDDDPCIDVTKTVDCEPSKWLDEVVFEVCVENCGDVTLYNITVVDDVMGDLSGYFAVGELDELAVGATVCADVPYTIPVGATSPHENTVTATGYTVTTESVMDTATETVDLIDPAMTIVVSCNEPEPVAPGETAEFSITVENTGDCNLVIPQDADFIPGETHTWTGTETASTDPGVTEVCHEACVTWTLDPELYCAMPNEGTVCHEECCPVDDDPCIDVTKTVDCEPSKWLDEVVFEVCVENCGDVTLYNITVVDDVMGDVSGYFAVGELDELAVGATVCADVPYTIPVGATSPHENTVTATGYTVTTESVMDTSTETVDLIDPAMTIVVSCNEPEPVAPGETAEFSITVENTGDCNLVIPQDADFIPGETHTWTGTETASTDPGVTEVCHEACVTWTLDPELYCAMPNEGTVCHEECCPVDDDPCIDVTKTVDCEPSKWLDEVVFEVCVENCGDVTLYNITVVDDVMGDVSGYFAVGELDELAVGATVCADVPYTIPVGATSPHENTVTATGYTVTTESVMDTATETVDLIDPAMTIVVSCNEPEPVAPGETAEFAITVENTGDCNLVIPQDSEFVPGETHTWYETETVPTDPGVTEVCHEACVTWTLDPELYCAMPNEGTVCHEECCPVDDDPCIDVTKTVDCEPSKWLDEVVFEVCVENCGDVTLYNITVVDDVMGDLSGYFAVGELDELAVGATVCADVPYTIPVGATSPHENTVTATGYTVTTESVMDTATETVDLIDPAMTIVVSCNEPEPVAPGETAEFSITVENTGDCNLVIPQDADFIPGETHTWTGTETASTDPGVTEVCHEACVTWTLDPELYCAMPNEGTVCHEECCPVDDDPCIDVTKTVDCEPSKWLDEVVFEVCVENCGDVTLYNITVVDDVMGDLSGYFAVGELDELAVGATVCADVPYTIPVGATSPHENTVTATGYTVTTESVMDTATETVDLIDPAMTIVVSCNEPEPVAPGETAEFAITVENTGDCNLVIPQDSEFVPGETHTWYETETVPTDPGVTEVCHEACVTWTLDPELYCAMPNEGTVCHEECCPVDDDPCIDVTKTVDCEPSKWLDEVVFEVCVENCGDVTLYNITVVDDVMGDLSGYFAVGELDELAVGATVCADVPYTIPVGATSPHENTVTATGYTVTTESVMDTSTETVDLINPALTIEGICLTDPVEPGGTAEYQITATNTGDCNLVIPADSELVPGETATWTETEVDPGGVTEVCHEACVTWTLDPELYCAMPNEGTVCDTICCPVQAGCRWTGGGTIDWEASIPAGAHVTHGFQFRCDLRPPNRLQVNWGMNETGPPGDKWHMTELLSATCIMNPELDPPDTPVAPCNEVFATGVGRYNNENGYIAEFHFTDQGQPGVNDWAEITITAPDGTIVLQAEGYLEHGNHQAHRYPPPHGPGGD